MFQNLNKIPEFLFTCSSTELLDVLGQPTLLHFSGKKTPALFLGVFLHGNETTSFMVLQELLKRYGDKNWPRETYVFIGNVWAAKESKRRLDSQPDFNRIWTDGELPENKMAMDVIETVNPRSLFAAIDIHNNTGRNPHYAISQYLDARHFNLAALFDKKCLYFSGPDYTLSHAFGKYCPAVTIECGLPGSSDGNYHALEFVLRVMSLEKIPEIPMKQLDLEVLDSLGTIKIESHSTVGIGDESGDICFASDFDLMNFKPIPEGTIFARYHGEHRLKFFSEDHRDVSDDFFQHKDGKVLTRVPLVPTMLKLDKQVIKNNCVGYAHRPLDLTKLAQKK